MGVRGEQGITKASSEVVDGEFVRWRGERLEGA